MVDRYDRALGETTVDGEPLVGMVLWHLLSEIEADEANTRALMWRCDCDDGVCSRVPNGPIYNRTWSRCPYTFLRSPAWRVVLWFDASVALQSSGALPLQLAAWVVEGATALRRARAARAKRKKPRVRVRGR